MIWTMRSFFRRRSAKKTVKVASSSVNTGHGDNPGSHGQNFSFKSRALMTPDELMQLSDKKAIILVDAKNPIKANKCYWFKELIYQKQLNRNDFLR